MVKSYGKATVRFSRVAADRRPHARSAKAREPTVVKVVDLEKRHPLRLSDLRA
jgi:hypothetical protein